MTNVTWSREMSCYVWTCIYGCASGWDFESRYEAEQDFLTHKCEMSC